ncbi:WSC domain-containing protein 2 [Amphibalanus amphitrite]|uniref:WSC domain-containing protein 2 n=1 Tax=Amphibalanus amphitrite TaxID=1232801 RepID=A0A6A4WCT8_AMPAM|nr:WSC domain-containing protein 2 [Amphibalanus amphitrite]
MRPWPGSPRAPAAVAAGLCGCCLLLLAGTRLPLRPVPVGVPPLEDSGRVLGRPVTELWSASRPEQAWFTDDQCRPLVSRFTRDHSLPLVYLASFPRSGNTWTRYLLEASTGLITGGSSMPNYRQYKAHAFTERLSDENLWKYVNRQGMMVRLGYLGGSIPWSVGATIVTKTHAWPEPFTEQETAIVNKTSHKFSPFPKNVTRRAILIIRDPFKSFISLKKYGKTKSVLNEEDMSELFTGAAWEKFAVAYGRIWLEMNARWIANTEQLHVVTYERLAQDTMAELRSMLQFLDVQPDRRRLQCLAGALDGRAHNHRHGVVPDEQTYPLPVRSKVWLNIHQLNWLLRQRGFPGLPLERYSFADEFGDLMEA